MLKLFKSLGKKEFILAVIAIAGVCVQVWLELTMPEYMAQITRLVETEGSKMSEIFSSGAMMLVCAAGSLVACVVTAVAASRISSNFSAIVRGKVFKKVQSFSMEEIGRFSTASLITRSTNDVTQVQMLIAIGLQVMVKSPIMAVAAIAKISTKQSEWTISTVAAVVILLVVIIICLILATPKFRIMQKLTDDLNRVTRENLTGLRVVRAYNAEDYQEEKFTVANNNLTRNYMFAGRTMSFMMPSIQLVMSGLMLAVYWIGAILIEQAGIMDKIGLFSEMMVFSQYAIQVVMSFMLLVMIFMILPRAQVAANRIVEVLDTKTSITDGTRTEGLDGVTGEVEFKDVSFSYPDSDEPVINGISFKANKGETVAIIGSTGCGKSTVINLVPRFYDATKGEVLVDGVNVKEYTQEALRNKIGYISQRATLFQGSIESNIAYGSNGKGEITLDDVKEAAKIAQSADFIENIEGTYEGYVAQGGSNLSGGQKQRVSIARAIARNPEIFIFDDSFSALDYKTDRVLRKALDEYCKDATRLIVAQRIGTIIDADKIIVLDDGAIVGMGTHRELLETCEVYKQIASSQLSQEELA